jgi:hypothetical protein
LVFEAEFGSGSADGGFGDAEVGVGMHAVGGRAKGAGVAVGGDVVAVAVGLDGGDAAFPRGSDGVVFGAGAEHGGDMVRWFDLGGGDELALGPAVAREELLFERAEVADVVGVAVDPGDGIVVCAVGDDLLPGAGVTAVDVVALGLEPFKLATEVVAFAAVALEEPEGIELVVGLPDAEIGVFKVCALAFGVIGKAHEGVCLTGGEVAECLRDAVVFVSKLRRGQRAGARVRGFIGGEGLGAAVVEVAGKAGDGVLGGLGRSVRLFVV